MNDIWLDIQCVCSTIKGRVFRPETDYAWHYTRTSHNDVWRQLDSACKTTWHNFELGWNDFVKVFQGFLPCYSCWERRWTEKVTQTGDNLHFHFHKLSIQQTMHSTVACLVTVKSVKQVSHLEKNGFLFTIFFVTMQIGNMFQFKYLLFILLPKDKHPMLVINLNFIWLILSNVW